MEKEFLYFDPQLLEETVFAALKDNSDAKRFHRERTRIYEILSTQEREQRFRELHHAWFQRLRLADAIRQALAEQPTLSSRVGSCVVLRALGKNQEGAELFVSADEGQSDRERKTVRLLLRAESLLNRSKLLEFLRHELFHIADMLDQAFGYEPSLPPSEAGPAYDSLLRERYKALWDAAINGRLVKRGWLSESARAQHLSDFATAFPMLGDETEKIFSRFFDDERHTHAELVAFAQSPRIAADQEATGPQPGSRCPLCGFPTHAFEPEPDHLDNETLAAIVQDFPQWRPSRGLCAQCADLYRANRLSIQAARLLPGWH